MAKMKEQLCKNCGKPKEEHGIKESFGNIGSDCHIEKRCGKQITTHVWGNKGNPDTWKCALPRGHKGHHKRYTYFEPNHTTSKNPHPKTETIE